MGALDNIEKHELRELLCKGWMTHDAMWFFHALQELGIEKTNELNLAAIRSMSGFEVERIRKALGINKEKIESFEELAAFFTGGMDLLIGEFMHFNFSFPEKNVMRWEWERGECFAYKGLCRIGAIEQYRCGVMMRIQCWLDALQVKYEMDPPIDGCLMHERGSCYGEFHFSF